MANLVTRIALQDYRLAVAMMSLVCPKAIDATVRHEQVLLTLEDVDRSLAANGLPASHEIFRISYASDTATEPTEAEVVGEEN
jgi:hypothetical protein